MSEKNQIQAISPIDGRYANKCKSLITYFSEFALFKYRLLVEIEYFIELCELPISELKEFPKDKFSQLRNLYKNFTPEDALAIKDIEKSTNHDIKALEYFVKDKFSSLNIDNFSEFVHFGLTSQDINNTAIPLSIKDALSEVFIPEIEKLVSLLSTKSQAWNDIVMLARTHGQPASPTRLGKEIAVFVKRLEIQLQQLKNIDISAKFGGATGNFNAHYTAYPHIGWHTFAEHFVENNLKLKRSFPTTQIEHYDNLAALFQNICRINTILIDFSRDIWTYIMLEYFAQKHLSNEVGSSAMPHKINPIDFENAEGNLGIANAIASHLAEKLPISRLQRDLTDSTVLRNIGLPFAHTLISISSLIKGISKLEVNYLTINNDLENHIEILAEAVQTILRRELYPKPYEALKELTRNNKKISLQDLHNFIKNLQISESVKSELLQLTPFNYTGK